MESRERRERDAPWLGVLSELPGRPALSRVVAQGCDIIFRRHLEQ